MIVHPYESPEPSSEPPIRKVRWSFYDWLVLGTSLLWTGHFAISVLVWCFMVCLFTEGLRVPPDWIAMLDMIPAVVLLGLFTVTAIRAWRRGREALRLLLVALMLSVAAFAYDTVCRNFQMHIEWKMENSPHPFVYFTWWWYDERWFQ